MHICVRACIGFMYGTRTICAFLAHLIRCLANMGTSDDNGNGNGKGNSNDNNTITNDDANSSHIFPIPANQRVKRLGMDFYENTLGAPKYVVSIDTFVSLHISTCN